MCKRKRSIDFTPATYIKSHLSESKQKYHNEGKTACIKSQNIFFYFVSLKKTTHSPTQATFRYTIVGNLNDRSILSDEMANMCAKYPIHLIRKQSPLSAELEKKEQIKREYNRSQICRLNIECNESLTKNQIWILSPKMPYKVFYKVNRLSQL